MEKKCFLEYVDSAHALEGWIIFKYAEQKERNFCLRKQYDYKQEIEKTEILGPWIEKNLEQRVLFNGIGDITGKMEQSQVIYDIK